MKQVFKTLQIQTSGQGLIEFTDAIINFVKQSEIKNGLVNLSVLHTSASLVVQENASSDVLTDLTNFFKQLVPMNNALYSHTIEGIDDMPAHIKSALTQNHLCLSIHKGQLILGTWQGIFLFEHRLDHKMRTVLIHCFGE